MNRIVSIALVLIAGTTTLAGQTGESKVAPKNSAIARTPDGHPDLQGVWTHGTLTPFERPPALGTKAFYTDAELADVQRQATDRRSNRSSSQPGDVGGDNEAFVDTGYTFLRTRQTSIVVDPPDGRIAFLPEAEKKRQFNLTNMDDFETMSTWDRCITRSPMLMLPAGYNNGIRIVQTPTNVVVESEQIHEARIVPIDGRPHSPSALRSWTGDPRGRWEGDTLVIDSTNYNDRGWISTHAASGRLRGTSNSAALHVVERFTPLDPNTIQWEMTVEDPNVFAKPWRASLLLNRSDDYLIYEYACHEGNQAIELFLRGARFGEKR